MFRTLVKTDSLAIENTTLAIRYFELHTLRGGLRYSAEIVLAPGDRIILDDDSLTNLEACRLPTFDCRLIEVGGAERSGGLGEGFENRLQVGKAAPFGVGDRGLQPRVNGHRRFTFQ